VKGSVPLARRNLAGQRARLALSVGGVAAALLLILALDGIYGAILERVTAYPDNQGAPLIASQRGVETMHMSSSTIPRRSVEALRRDRRLMRADPILYTSLVVGRERRAFSYVIGFRDGGGPWAMASGRRRPRGAQVVLDERTAERLGARVGSTVSILGVPLRVVGLAGDAASVVSGLAFVDYDAFAAATRAGGAASYVLITPRGGEPGAVAADLEQSYPSLTVQTRERFSANERQVVSDMSTGLIRGMVLIGVVVGLAVAGLSIYTATTARLREYAVLKAIGMANRSLYGLVSRQSLVTVGAGLAVALILVLLLGALLPLIEPSVAIQVTSSSVARTAAITVLIGLVAALVPARKVAKLDPASVYRR
jgi:putative ABC transport system permease protein